MKPDRLIRYVIKKMKIPDGINKYRPDNLLHRNNLNTDHLKTHVSGISRLKLNGQGDKKAIKQK